MSTTPTDHGRTLPSLPSTDGSVNLLVAWRTLRKHWATALATALAVTVGVAFYTLGQKRIYETSATILFDPQPPRPLGKGVETVVDLGAGDYWNNREYYETQYKIIQSMRVALAVVHSLDLNHDGSFLLNAPAGAQKVPTTVTAEEAAEQLKARLSVQPIKDSRLATVRYDDADPSRAQKVLSQIIDTYIEQNLDDALASTNAAVDWLHIQLDKLKGDLELNEMSLHDYKMNKNMLSVAFDDQSNMLREEMKQVNDTLTTVRTKREEVISRRNALMAVAGDDPTNLPATELLQSPLLQQLRQRFVDAQRDRNSLLSAGKGPSHPEVAAAQARLHDSEQALLAEVRNIKGALDGDVGTITRQEAGLAGLFGRAKKEALDLNLLEIEYNRLKRSKENTEKLYQLVLERTKESDLTRMMRVNNLRVIDRPLVPRTPIRPRVMLNILLGCVAGLVFGVAAAMGRALLDRTLKTPEDIERELGFVFLGLLPQIANEPKNGRTQAARRRGHRAVPENTLPELIVHERPASGIAEAAKAIRTNLLFMAPDNPYKTLLITSAGPSEGKTTVACCIAITMAQAGQRVVLVDCDLRRPRIHRIFGKSSETGVTTLLLSPASLDDLDLETTVPNLSAIAAGPIPPNPAELLQSERFLTFLNQLKTRFDRVILDSPPVVAVTDAAILSTIVDGTVLVVRGFKTTKDLARHGARSLNDVGGKTAGVVLNAVDLDRHEYKYYHYYYKRDNYYAAAPEQRSRKLPESPSAPIS